MRFVETKTFEQQSCLMLHGTRHLFICQRDPGSFCPSLALSHHLSHAERRPGRPGAIRGALLRLAYQTARKHQLSKLKKKGFEI